ncbi:flagellar basal body L-ring protein FlgH [Cellvibrio japonicus]|uniref:Flagellar L-ring protein n=1 Tax=Cellvibrio japonicus (strain Ueda107) TaxID=498211 RepID=B3PGS2_CELJU|nr:flagellar basal body L-ring protein FlgH [Cellvibrio japonicus]ACE83395.1 flagellar L-ring protein FlgH [Cellvibrio japonicus Ueda107]QEI12417.1 flagellar basal body L-ring protein FlgH [Cellvibrio japonicus]QEI15990.1 flagellar basal body L-ring protein FlgH [Cellvibrio japonicus]QEI19569.1 flagellar basal body L-ring protein FlgH [Cellvibrio japonicus]
MNIPAMCKWLLMVSAVSLLIGCGGNRKPIADDPAYAPTIASNMSVPQRTEGSLYQDVYGVSLFNDRKAHFVGDVITVTLSERTVSRKSSGVTTGKKSGVNFNAGPLLGANPTIKDRELTTTLTQDRTFDGSADADQSNSLQGNITVTVAEILPNGNLIVRGEKWITLNRGDEFIRISGIVRPEDIAPDNTIVSTRLANAKISYSGTGELANAQKMGWLSRFFNSDLWPL